MKFTIALVQTDLRFAALEENLTKLEGFIREAAGKGANIIVLPESCNIGYDAQRIEQMAKMSEMIDGATVTRMRQIAAENGVWLIVPCLLRDDDGCKNCALIISGEGKIIGKYAKTHPTLTEGKWINDGDVYPVFDTEFGRLGVMICNDVGYPEVARLLALQDPDIVFIPAAWAVFPSVPHWWSVAVQARAMENVFMACAVNHVGPAGEGTLFCGESRFISPDGTVLQAFGMEEGILLQDVCLEEIREAKQAYRHLITARKPWEYKELCKTER